MRGPRPKSAQLKTLQGNAGHRAPVETGDPFTVGVPEKPTGLDQYASEEWDRLVTHLAPVLSGASRGMLLVCVDAFAQMMTANAALAQKGLTYETTSESGSIMIRQRPEVRMKENARTAYHRALVELGAAPAAQTRVQRLPEKRKPTGVKKLLDGSARFFTSS